jgi:hypothetical protein
MKSLLNCCAFIVLGLVALTSANADVARPRDDGHKSPQIVSVSSPMHIEPNTKATEARLLIPRAVLEQMRAGLDGDNAPAAGTTARLFTNGGAQTALAGIFLSLAFAFGGVWLVRTRKPAGTWTRATLGVILLALCGATASIAYANAGPPPIARSLTSGILSPGAQPYGAYGQVKVEITDERSQITLVLPISKEHGD